jgi:hypothetical protein
VPSPFARAPKRGRLRLHVGTFVATLIATACTEPTLPLHTQPAVAPRNLSDAGVLPNGTPLGIGGAYTLNVSGPYVTPRDPSPSGITMFPGIPVEVIVSGQITREMTDGFLNHCTLLPFACPPIIRSNAPFGPGGLADSNLGAATSWWDSFFGAYFFVSPGGSVAYRGLSGTNLLLGRTGLFCTWGHVFSDGTVEEGDCYKMGGGFTYTVHTRKAPVGQPGQAGLTLAITKNGMGPSGGPVDLTAATTDGSAATDLTWYFIADAVTEETDPAPAPQASRASTTPQGLSASRSLSVAGSGMTGARGSFPAPGQRVRAINAQTGDTTITTDIHTLPAGDYVFLSDENVGAGVPGETENGEASFAASSAAWAGTRMTPWAGTSPTRQLVPSVSRASSGSTTPYEDGGTLPSPITGSARLDGCAGSLTCSVNLKVEGGTFVVTGVVRGVLRAAEQRIAALPEDPSTKPHLYVIIDPKTDELLEFERHIAGGNCAALQTVSTRRLHVTVIDSSKTTPEKVPNRAVTLKLAAVVPADPRQPDAGGHAIAFHTGNPKPPGRLAASQVVTDANGDAFVVYHASEWGGKYEVRGESEGAVPGADTIRVGIPLQALGAGAHYGFIGATSGHPSNHFGTATMNGRLATFADQLFESEDISIQLNDISLPLGGRFEVKDGDADASLAWTNSAHCDHREGRGTDLRTTTFMDKDKDTKAKPSLIVKAMMAKWSRLNADFTAGQLPYFWEGDHLHLKTVR